MYPLFLRDHADKVHQDWIICESYFLTLLTLLVEDSALESPVLGTLKDVTALFSLHFHLLPGRVSLPFRYARITLNIGNKTTFNLAKQRVEVFFHGYNF